MAATKEDYASNPAVINLRNYLKIRTVQPNVDYGECIKFLQGLSAELGLPCQVFEPLPGKPVLLMSWRGSEPTLPAVLLNSHMDVVPVFEKSWSHPPFEAYMDSEGVIFGRGIQDMKSVGIQYVEAVRRLKKAGVTLKRTLHLLFVPDEEIGGQNGMAEFVKTAAFGALNVGVALDEGVASAGREYAVFAGERSIWHITFLCPGTSGHGSLLHENTAGEKIQYIINKMMELRAKHKRRLQEQKELTIGDVTTVNLTMLSGGVQENVVPELLTASFDIRLDLSVNHQEFEDMLKKWCEEAGGVTMKFTQKEDYVAPTKLDDTNPYWTAFKGAADKLDLKLSQRVFPGGTDSRYLRELGLPAIGFSPMAETPLLLHAHDERLPASTFLHGITIYEKIIPAVANVE